MKRFSIASAAALAGLCLLASGFASQAHEPRYCKDYGLKPIGLYVLGQSPEQFASNPPKGGLEGILSELKTDLSYKELGPLLEKINNEPTGTFDVPVAFQGIGGFTTAILLQRFISAGGTFVSRGGVPIAEKVVYGKIRDYVFVEATKSGHLSVDVYTDDRLTAKRELYHWDIRILSEGFNITPRDDTKPDNPFSLPAEFKLPAETLDPTNPRSIWYRGLDHKLGAKGTKIEVVNVYYRNLNPSGTALQLIDRNIDRYYKSVPDSCVDLFTQGHPPATFGELAGNDYCLGRCTHPAIYNSGE